MNNLKKDVCHESPFPQSQRGRPREFDRAEAVNVAMEIFWRNGYMQTTLGDLCAAMGITAPSFYCAFNTREDLFLETVNHYKELYWNGALQRLLAESNLYTAFETFFCDAVKIYLRPNLPKGCFIDISTVGLSSKESRIIDALVSLDRMTSELFRKRLMLAIDTAQIPSDCDIPSITGSLIAFMKGVAGIARQDLCQAELLKIANRGLLLLPLRK